VLTFERSLRLTLIVGILGVTFHSSSRADNAFQDAWGVATDPAGLKKTSKELSDSVERTMIQLKELEGIVNGHVTDRLEQIRSIIHDALGGTDAVIQKAIASMSALEKQVNLDAINLIYVAKCAADVTLQDTAQKAFADLLSTVQQANPSIQFLGLKIIDLKTKNVKITAPDAAYISAKAVTMADLEKSTTDGSKAYEILSVYQNLETAAKYNRCFYHDQTSATIWAEEANDLERLSIPWTATVVPDINFTPK